MLSTPGYTDSLYTPNQNKADTFNSDNKAQLQNITRNISYSNEKFMQASHSQANLPVKA